MNGGQGLDTPAPAPYCCRRPPAGRLDAVAPVLAVSAERHSLPDEKSPRRLDRVVARLLGEFEFRPRIQGIFGGVTKLGAEFCVSQDSKEVDEFSVEVVVDFNLCWLLREQNCRRAAERLDVGKVRRKVPDDLRRELRLASEKVERRRDAHALTFKLSCRWCGINRSRSLQFLRRFVIVFFFFSPILDSLVIL